MHSAQSRQTPIQSSVSPISAGQVPLLKPTGIVAPIGGIITVAGIATIGVVADGGVITTVTGIAAIGAVVGGGIITVATRIAMIDANATAIVTEAIAVGVVAVK